jgi:hypothetical protein
MTEDNKQIIEDDGTSIVVEYEVKKNTPRGYATNLIVQHTEHEFIISFFDFEPPLVIGSDEERREQVKKLGHLKAKCIARIMVSPGRMEEFINALKTNFDKYEARHLSETSEE